VRKLKDDNIYSQLHIADELAGIVEGWENTGWPGLTETTYNLFRYWFKRDDDSSEKFHTCQQRAIETIVYCHEILQVRNLEDLYSKIAPDIPAQSKAILDEIKKVDFAKYCLKMATGTGKTWVLLALLIWQYFNAKNNEKPHGAAGESIQWYSDRFLVVAPGREVLDRLLDAFKGRRDPNTGLRNPSMADYNIPLMMPEAWRIKFNIQIFEPSEIRPNITPPEDSFIFITNWQQFELKREHNSIWEDLTGHEIGDRPRGEFLADFLSEYPSIVIMNDEAHHVHAGKTGSNEELVWRKFIRVVRQRSLDRHKDDSGLFIQYDFSATPFFGSGTHKKYFEHIVYNYDLIKAMHAMLVKQLFLEKRMQLAGENLDFRARRNKAEQGKRLGDIIGLSEGQLLLLDIGRRKLEKLSVEFRANSVNKKPVMMVLCEETSVARMVKQYFQSVVDFEDIPYDDKKVIQIHTELSEEELTTARRRLDRIDDNSDPLNVVISVLMLREGFDRKNISVIVVLRATEADLLLEQLVGRGLRLMFPKTENESIWQSKIEALEDIKNNKAPHSSFDCLFVVEHPRFEKFYQNLRNEGYLIGIGDTSNVKSTGDIIPVDAVPSRISDYDINWPVQIFDQGSFPNLDTIEVSKLTPYSTLTSFHDLRESLGKMVIQEVHYESGKRTKTWKFDTNVFSYNMFLSKASHAVAEEGKTSILSGHFAEIAALIDEYVSRHLFRQEINFVDPKNCIVLNYVLIFNFIVEEVRKAILFKLGEIRYDYVGRWRKLSDITRLMLREKYSIETWKTIYTRQGFSAKGGGFEKNIISNLLEQSSEVLAYAKLDKRHALLIPYRDEFGILREYEVDFIIKTNDKTYLLETKSDKDLYEQTVLLKAKAAHSWCLSASRVSYIEDIKKLANWEYLVLSEGLFKANSGLGFDMFVPLCKELRNRMIGRYDEISAKIAS
jgi:type III restriction enzyme